MGDEDEGAGQPDKLQEEAVKKLLFMRILDEGARRRLNNIRFANPQFAEQVEAMVLQIVQSGRAQRVDEPTLIQLINRLKGPQRETRIIRK
jgi:DNA-binding TFAR19-related protein (PDSD5 family)